MDIPLWWSWVVTQFEVLLGLKSKDQKEDRKQEKGGSSDPREQLDDTKQANNVNTQKSSSRKRRRTPVGSKAVSLSPRQLEQATDQETGLADKVKFQTQVALGLLTLSAGAIISVKDTTFARQASKKAMVGGQAVNLPDFLYWSSITLWFTALLFGVFIILLTMFHRESKGLLIYAKRINAFILCASVLGVAFWIFS